MQSCVVHSGEEQKLILEVILVRIINPCMGLFNTSPDAWKTSQQKTDHTKPVCSQQFPVDSIIFSSVKIKNGPGFYLGADFSVSSEAEWMLSALV